ncbi:hypothetical protein CONLIGDRAFT_692485 [Coniochaeta ligniaria NRRL 30616]|uniref:Uncharacterized protein n=1 Tax=Coniochaeta ligniaria NRRL 30616 TaxID=1408157 RepID=A0A1J7I9F1_9PEZI|nr:hypothetical protein CONLIGDRAFT_692485 [Coniochaeta ligniaria NRRL 30616]
MADIDLHPRGEWSQWLAESTRTSARMIKAVIMTSMVPVLMSAKIKGELELGRKWKRWSKIVAGPPLVLSQISDEYWQVPANEITPHAPSAPPPMLISAAVVVKTCRLTSAPTTHDRAGIQWHGLFDGTAAVRPDYRLVPGLAYVRQPGPYLQPCFARSVQQRGQEAGTLRGGPLARVPAGSWRRIWARIWVDMCVPIQPAPTQPDKGPVITASIFQCMEGSVEILRAELQVEAGQILGRI